MCIVWYIKNTTNFQAVLILMDFNEDERKNDKWSSQAGS
jgi:hypothetical protein